MSALTILSLLSLSLAAVFCTPVTDQQVELKRGSCPMFWFSFNSRCYKYIATVKNWAHAELHCVSEGANLASVHSLEEFNFIQNLIKNFDPEQGRTWIGLTDIHLEDGWMWSDGSKVGFTQWYDGEPSNSHYGKEHCVHTNYYLKWNDWLCSSTIPFVCASRVV